MKEDLSDNVGIIMAGGSGTRFWPLSRKDKPKQLLELGENKVMLEATFDRLSETLPEENILVITSEQQVDLIRDKVPRIPQENIIAEPIPKDTAACVGVGAVITRQRFGPDAVMGMFPADHRIANDEIFHQSLQNAYRACESLNEIITFGIEPDEPSTGYGYILYDEQTSRSIDGSRVYRVNEFTEKPDRETAEHLLERGGLWNSGIFFWTVSHIVSQFEEHLPTLSQQLDRIAGDLENGKKPSEAMKKHYPDMQEVSVDYGIMEQTDSCWTLPVNFEWNDLGTFSEIDNLLEPDNSGNVPLGDQVTIDTSESILINTDGPLIATVGLEDMVVISTEDAVLVCNRDDSQRVKEIVKKLEDREYDDLL